MTQIVIGILTIIIGIISISTLTGALWVVNTGSGFWAGGWILTTGILGVCAGKNTKNSCLVGVHLAFNIIATIIAFLDGIFFAVALGYVQQC